MALEGTDAYVGGAADARAGNRPRGSIGMALTMTRTRTQTTLTKLAKLVANVHGELAFVEGLLAGYGDGLARGGMETAAEAQGAAEAHGRLLVRRQVLLANREALYATIRQFDPGIAPGQIGAGDGWHKRYRRGVSLAELARRYEKELALSDGDLD